MADASPYVFRDMRRAVVRKTKVSPSLVPENSVDHAINFDFDTIIGSAVSRLGILQKGADVATGKKPLGLTSFIGSVGTPNIIIVVHRGSSSPASDAKISYWNGSAWVTSNVTNWLNTAKVRFANLANYVFATNGIDRMRSTQDGATWGFTNTIDVGIRPSLIMRSKNRLIASGWTTYPSRVYFSKIVEPQSSPAITWDTNASTGDWIDVNPDDGDYNTAFAEVSNLVLIFKKRAMYRLNVITKTVDVENIFNIGAYSQEGVTNCLGQVFFYTGKDIRMTDGGFPNQISRLAVQDWLDAIPESNKGDVCAGTDTDSSVYFDIGDVTVRGRNYQNVTLKYSVLDQCWTVYAYSKNFNFFTNYLDPALGYVLIGADDSGAVQTLNTGFSDNGAEIPCELETQEIEFGNRAHTKGLGKQFMAFMKNGKNANLMYNANDTEFKKLLGDLTKRVNIHSELNIKCQFMVFRLQATAKGQQIIFEGFQIEEVKDLGPEKQST